MSQVPDCQIYVNLWNKGIVNFEVHPLMLSLFSTENTASSDISNNLSFNILSSNDFLVFSFFGSLSRPLPSSVTVISSVFEVSTA